ncbi:hypothetical protein QVD17_16301 [Tagetes erecta]|uniref:PB1 domain-containing protein n=1 Tax=Tagetes erecta TaxID=13708 RepID=A0AAD8KUX3_TARER|nr:hypothetical protein QVD17_16301 [Tagetes erecta]
MTRITNSSSPSTIKFLYSYAGKILPRNTDGNLHYIGGHTRVLTTNRSITFSELIVKFFESFGFSVNLKFKLPSEDVDVLISVTCDEDLRSVIEEYDRVSTELKIRVLLFPVKSLKTISPVPSFESIVDYSMKPKPVACLRKRDCYRCGKLPVPDRRNLFVRDCNVQWLNNRRLGGR